jgi:hypothetical protein
LKYVENFANFWVDFLDILFNIRNVKPKTRIMEKFVVYIVLLILCVVSYHLMKKFDTSKRRKVFVMIWAICMLAFIVYPLFLPGWWKLGFFLSNIINIVMMFSDAENEEEIQTPLGS